MRFDEFVVMAASEERWESVDGLPWGDADFSRRMLAEHLSQAHDGGSRRSQIIDQQVAWIDEQILQGVPSRILDVGCGPGLYLERLALRGHRGVGIDVAPACVEYAIAHRSGDVRYACADFNAYTPTETFDLVMMVHGEFNVLSKEQAASLLRRIAPALSERGRLLLELHPPKAVERIGGRPRNWTALRSGLFSDEPHVRMDESRWFAEQRAAINLFWVLHSTRDRADKFGVRTQAYTDDELETMLRDAGLTRVERYPSLGEEPSGTYTVLVASA